MAVRAGKFNARKTIADGILFDSRKEAKRYLTLRKMEQAGEISDLRTQVVYHLIPPQREPDRIGPKGGKIKGRLIERGVDYIADFVYVKDGQEIVEDVKGRRTPEYVIKRKLMRWVHSIGVTEI